MLLRFCGGHWHRHISVLQNMRCTLSGRRQVSSLETFCRARALAADVVFFLGVILTYTDDISI